VSGEAINLEYKMKRGDTLQYKTTVTMNQEYKEGEEASTTTSQLDMLMVQRVTDVSADSFSIDVTIESGTHKRDGQEEEIPNVGQTISVKMNKYGKITETSVEFPFEQPPFPSKPVKQGESWKGESRLYIPGKPEPVTLVYEYSLWDLVRAHGYECAEIQVKCPETFIMIQEGITQKLVASGTTYFAYKEGKLVKSEVETKTEVTGENTSVITNTRVKVELLELAPPATESEEGFIVR